MIGIVDADYLVDPDFLARCAPLFAEPDVAFVQTPQDYRDWDVAPYFRRLYRSYAYFFDVSQRSRAERNGAIFGGTMGLIRRSAMETAGGWDEWCITEDAELSLRLLRAGGRGIHVDRSFGRGLMPLTFEALKRQRFRWCFGGVQILRMHWRSLLPGRRAADNRLDLAQRWAYLVGGLQWFGDLASVLFTGFLLVGASDLVLGEGLVVRRMSGLILACVLVLVVLGALRSLALVRRTSGAGWRESLGAFGIWLALGWTVALACVRGLTAREGAFLRTPKVKGDLGWRDAVRGNRTELVAGLVCLAVAAVVVLRGGWAAAAVGGLLAVHAAGYFSAPVNSLAAIRSDLPEDLRRRRREAVASWGTRSARRGGLVLVATAAVLVAFVALAAPVQGPRVTGIGDRIGDRVGDLTDGDDDRTVRKPPGEQPGTGDAPTGTIVPGSSVPATEAVVVTSPAGTRGSARPSSTPRTTPSTRPTTAAPSPTSPRTTPTQRSTPTQAQKPTTRPTGRPTQAASPTGRPTDRPTGPGGRR
ncbi:Glycosyltransferases, probably involved in cell wall biogenesis [Nocardioides sp. J9]|uniref:glycosyltransferase family 2 protein n=1 Tax=Nocardioides sp. J9 TaxID=935844 RepID=UPI0011AB9FB0|nr:glycosyltransferase family 2 protein [Nocardioides sp. J9]TWG94846.1 Glycosyltransferases, probably involved in cell wall biogenesis [Nocardioides sp. J9]